MTTLEYRYRRVLRLLPAAYRETWEADMVSAFMDSVEGTARRGPSVGERLSVVRLAARLRLSGDKLSPRGQSWRDSLRIFIAAVALVEALAATVSTAATIARIRSGTAWFDPSITTTTDYVRYWYPLVGLAWVAVFGCLVFGRTAAARVLAVLSFLASAGFDLWLRPPVDARYDVYTYIMLAVPVLIAILAAAGPPLSRWWLAAYVLPALALAPAAWASVEPPFRAWPYIEIANVEHVLLIAGLVVGLVVRSPRWLLPLAVFAICTAGPQLMYDRSVLRGARQIQISISPNSPWLWLWVDGAQLALAIVCAIVGLVLMSRIPKTHPRLGAAGAPPTA
jgi:hypothetical protein